MQLRNSFTVFNLFLLFYISSSFTISGNKKTVAQSQAIEFKTDGLFYAEFYDFIFLGHFENVKVKQDDVEFLTIFEQYLRSYGKHCDQFLPQDKVEIMNLVCAEYYVEKNFYGDVLSRTCTQ